MSGSDYTRIRLGDGEVGIVGLAAAFDEAKETLADKADQEVGRALLERVKAQNYIPVSAQDRYSEALVREFRKFLGHSCEDGQDYRELSIKVLGPGCSQCDQLVARVIEFMAELELPASVEHITDLLEIASYGFVKPPALVINGRVFPAGSMPTKKRIIAMLAEAGVYVNAHLEAPKQKNV
ncbi:MAG: thioredoxin family protein [Deltaproteobacteria bacterium]|nr:thioredoxin family protein [Deltaproteobacteria bacterium]